MFKRQEDATVSLFVTVSVRRLILVLEEMVSNDRVNLDLSEEATTSLDNTEEEKSNGDSTETL